MKNYLKFSKTLAIILIIFNLIFFMYSCKGMDDKASKAQTVIDKPLAEDGVKADISVKKPPASLNVNSISSIEVSIKNISNTLWPAKGQPGGHYSINLAYHWLDKDGKVIIWDGMRTPLPHDVKPKEEVVLYAKVKSPDKPGEYILEFDMVQERVAWFKNRGSKTVRLNVEVK